MFRVIDRLLGYFSSISGVGGIIICLLLYLDAYRSTDHSPFIQFRHLYISCLYQACAITGKVPYQKYSSFLNKESLRILALNSGRYDGFLFYVII